MMSRFRPCLWHMINTNVWSVSNTKIFISLLFGLLDEVPHVLLVNHDLFLKEPSKIAYLILLQPADLRR